MFSKKTQKIICYSISIAFILPICLSIRLILFKPITSWIDVAIPITAIIVSILIIIEMFWLIKKSK